MAVFTAILQCGDAGSATIHENRARLAIQEGTVVQVGEDWQLEWRLINSGQSPATNIRYWLPRGCCKEGGYAELKGKLLALIESEKPKLVDVIANGQGKTIRTAFSTQLCPPKYVATGEDTVYFIVKVTYDTMGETYTTMQCLRYDPAFPDLCQPCDDQYPIE